MGRPDHCPYPGNPVPVRVGDCVRMDYCLCFKMKFEVVR